MSRKTHPHHHSGHPSNGEMRETAERLPPTDEQLRLIQLRAYGLWERDGRPDGDAASKWFWSEAEKSLAAAHERDE